MFVRHHNTLRRRVAEGLEDGGDYVE